MRSVTLLYSCIRILVFTDSVMNISIHVGYYTYIHTPAAGVCIYSSLHGCLYS